MSFLDALILGAVEGFTEFLPISSTAHLILTSKILNLGTSEFLKSFEISIQLGAIFAVVFLYPHIFFKNWGINKKILTAFLPTALIGFLFYGVLKNFLLVNHFVSVYSLIIGGIFIIIFEMVYKEKSFVVNELKEISYKKSILIGLAQGVSIIPGVSRAAATIFGGLALGISRKTVVEFSFLLAVPTMIAATGFDLIQNYNQFSISDWKLLFTGFIVSFLVAALSIKFLLNYIKTNNFIPFGIYRIVVALLFLI